MSDPNSARFLAALEAHQRSQLDAAASGYDDVLQHEPGHAGALQLKGALLLQRGEPLLAVELLESAIRLDPKAVQPRSNLASALIALGRYDEAVEAARAALRLSPKAVDALGNLATALRRLHRDGEAARAYQEAIALAPQRAGLHSGLGLVLGELERYDEALAAHRHAVGLAPNEPRWRSNLSQTLRAAGFTDDAEDTLRAVVLELPDDAGVVGAFSRLLTSRGKLEEALEMVRSSGAANDPLLRKSVTFIQNYLDRNSVEGQLESARAMGQTFAEGATADSSHANPVDPDRPLRVGLVSADLRNHAVAQFLAGFLPEIRRSELVLHAYSGLDPGDTLNKHFQRVIPYWRSVATLSDEALAAQVRADRIDILIDLSGPTAGGRLGVFARKPAPVSLVWLGYSGTTGLEAIDYILGDRYVLPEGVAQSTEQPWLLPDAYLCYSTPRDAPPVAPTPALANGHITFGSFNNPRKLSGATLDLWTRLLDTVPDAHLLLKAGHGDTAAEDLVRLRREVESRGIERHRIEVIEWVDGKVGLLPSYARMDIALDPFPYNGTTTTSEALMMGVPVVTLEGDRFISRVSTSILSNLGRREWIAADAESYVTIAAGLAADIPALDRLRQGLRAEFVASPLCDAPRFARNFEAALRGMWRQWCARQGEGL